MPRRRQKSLWVSLPLWACMVALVAWGLLQFSQFRHTLLAESTPTTAPASTASASQPQTQATGTADGGSAADPLLEGEDGSDKGTETAARPDAPPPPPVPTIEFDTSEQVNHFMTQAHKFLDAGRIVEGRNALNSGLALLDDQDPPAGDDPRAQAIRDQLTQLNAPIFLGTAVLPDDPDARYVEIRHGDSFLKFAHEYAVPAEFLMAINPGLNPRDLKPLTGVKVVRGPFNLQLSKHASRLDLFLRDMYVRSYPVQLDDGNYLPHGKYRIRVYGKIAVGSRRWIGYEGTDGETRDVTFGWIYGSPGPRAGSFGDRTSGIKLADADLFQLYNVLVETRSLLRVSP